MNRDDEDSNYAKMLVMDAAKFGFDIGYMGHMEAIDWVKKKLDDMKERAAGLGVLDQVTDKYNLGKELGMRKRMQSIKDFGEEKDADGKEPRTNLFEEIPSTLIRDAKKRRDAEYDGSTRIPTKDGISAIANLERMADKSHWIRRQINSAFSGIADLHDGLNRLPEEGKAEEIIAKGLEKVKEEGWIFEYKVESVHPETTRASISVISRITEHYGNGPEPVCKIISLALETIGQKAFRKPVQVIEKICRCQGEERCQFSIVPRRLKN